MNLLRKYFWLMAMLVLQIGVNVAQAATLTPSLLNLTTNKSANITVSGISGSVTLIKSSDYSLFTHSQLKTGNIITVTSLNKVGSGRLEVRDAYGSRYVSIFVSAPVLPMSVTPTSLSLGVGKSANVTIQNASGTISVSVSPTTVISFVRSGNTVTVTGKVAGNATLTVRDSKTTINIPVTVTSSSANLNGRLLASNCYQCHGTNGSGGFERLAGEQDMYNELQEFLAPNGEHADGIMAAHLKGYTTAQLQAIANYFKNLNY